jgi:hypothetical protein
MVAKALHVHPIETAEVPCIVEPDADFANVVQGATCQGQCLLNADKNLACLRFNASRTPTPPEQQFSNAERSAELGLMVLEVISFSALLSVGQKTPSSPVKVLIACLRR